MSGPKEKAESNTNHDNSENTDLHARARCALLGFRDGSACLAFEKPE
jgi:hypothetical protein